MSNILIIDFRLNNAFMCGVMARAHVNKSTLKAAIKDNVETLLEAWIMAKFKDVGGWVRHRVSVQYWPYYDLGADCCPCDIEYLWGNKEWGYKVIGPTTLKKPPFNVSAPSKLDKLLYHAVDVVVSRV